MNDSYYRAQKQYDAQLPPEPKTIPCEDCDGTGERWKQDEHTEEEYTVECPFCNGIGLVKSKIS